MEAAGPAILKIFSLNGFRPKGKYTKFLVNVWPIWPRMDTPRARSLEDIGICFQISSPVASHVIFVPPIQTRELLFKRHFSTAF